MNKSGHSGKFIRRIAQAAIVLGCIVAGFVLVRKNTMASFDPSEAMKYSQYASNHTIEDSTLFIGTYLISMEALTDELYQKAQTSASDSGQSDMYYKSELASGSWFNVSDAEGLSDIMETGDIISEDELADLYVQYYVGKDGVVVDVMTGESKNPFDIPDPYDLSKLPELNPLWLQYTSSDEADEISEEDYLKNKNSKDAGSTRRDIYNYRLLTKFFGMDLRDSITDGYDADLARLFACYQTLKDSGQDEEADLIYGLMAKVDAARRQRVMEKLSTLDTNALDVLYELANGKYYTTFGDFKDSDSDEDDVSEDPDYIRDLRDAVSHEFREDDESDSWWSPLQSDYDNYHEYATIKESDDEDEDDEDNDKTYKVPREAFATDDALLSAIGDSTESCQQSYNTYLSNALSDSDSILGHADYEYSRQVIDEASASGAGGPINYLRDIKNIEDNIVKHSDSEKDLLESALLSLGESRYEGDVSSGVPEEYLTAISSGTGAAAADTALNDQEGKAEASRTELEYLIDAFKQREESGRALDYVDGCISWTNGLGESIPSDEFEDMAQTSVKAHLDWLQQLRQEIIDSDASLKSKLDELNDKKEELQKKRDSALDNNDLASAADLDAQIAAVDNDIADEEAKTGLDSSDSGDGSGGDDSGDGSGGGNGSGSGAGGGAGGAGGAGGGAGGAGAGSGADAGGDGSGGDGSGDGSGDDGSGAGSGDESIGGDDGADKDKSEYLDEEDILNILEDVFGKNVDQMNDGELATATAAVSRFGRSGNSAAVGLAGTLADKMRSKNNKYLYNQYNLKTPEYISLKTIGDCTPYRYFYDNTKRTATMTQGAKAFVFVNGKQTVNRANDDEEMKYVTGMQKYPYISEDDAENLFGCTDEYVVKTSFAVCLTSSMESKVDEVLKALQET